MIHYTLLPNKEMKSLKREYKTRVFIILSLFLSSGLIIGIIALTPAFIMSYVQEKEALTNIQAVQKEKEKRGIDAILAELTAASGIIERLQKSEGSINFSEMVSGIMVHRSGQIYLTSFKFEKPVTGSSTAEVIVQGKASNRDSLINFKKNLESDARISSIELPVSDLAKSKDISFAIRFHMTQ